MRALKPRVRWENDTLRLQWGRRLKGDTLPIIHFTSRQNRSKHFLLTGMSFFPLISCNRFQISHSSIVLKNFLFQTTPHYDEENALMFSRSFRFPDAK